MGKLCAKMKADASLIIPFEITANAEVEQEDDDHDFT
jgi:hypothetical protein